MADERRDQPQILRDQAATILAAESLRSGGLPPCPDGKEAREDKGIPMVWRIFGGTVLSITALVAVTLYQQLHNKVENLGDISLKREEFFEHRKGVWDRIEKLRAQEDGIDGQLKERCTRLEEQAKIGEEHHKDAVSEMNQIREMLFSFLKETTNRVEQRAKMGEEERKSLVSEIQHLRERLATLESAKAKQLPVKPVKYQKKGE
jgi:hypothetical protein